MQVVRICLAGTYQVQFTAGVDPASLNVMIEPAVECRLAVQYNGETVSAEKLAEIPEGETVTTTYAVQVESGTDDGYSLFWRRTASHTVHEVDGKQIIRSDTGGVDRSLYSLVR